MLWVGSVVTPPPKSLRVGRAPAVAREPDVDLGRGCRSETRTSSPTADLNGGCASCPRASGPGKRDHRGHREPDDMTSRLQRGALTNLRRAVKRECSVGAPGARPAARVRARIPFCTLSWRRCGAPRV